MDGCIYDNPETMAREFWQHGHKFGSYPAGELVEHPLKGQQSLIGPRFSFGTDMGSWKAGQLCGDKAAMTPN